MFRSQCLGLFVSLFLGLGTINADVVTSRVISGLDDAEEHLDDNRIDLTSTDLELGEEGVGDFQEIGIRFQNIDIAVGSIIQNATIQFTVDENNNTQDTSVRIFGELSPNPLEYADIAGNISTRTKTTSFVDWNNIPIWDTNGVAGPDQLTPDLASVVQEIINQPGWSANNAMAFIITANPGGERTAESFNGDPLAAPLLSVTFAVPEPSVLLFATGFGMVLVRTRRRSSGQLVSTS